MAFTVTTSTLGGVAARLITGTGNLDDLATALSTHGVTKFGRTLTFAGTGANTFYAMDGQLTEQRSGVWTVRIGTQSFLCLARASGSVSTLGKIETNGAISSAVNIQYTRDHFPQGGDPFSVAEYKCFVGIGTLNFYAGSLSWETPSISGVDTESDMDIWPATAGANFDAVQVAFEKNGTQYAHIYTSLVVTTTTKTSFLFISGSFQEVTVWGFHPTAVWNLSVGSFYITTGLRLTYPGAQTYVTVQKPQYTQLESFGGVTGGTCKIYDPSVNYHTGAADLMLFTIYRTVKTTFKDTLAVNVGSPTPNLVVLNPDASTNTVAYSSGYAEYAAKQSVTSSNVAYNMSGTGWTDYGTYSFYAVGFGYAAAQTGINVKTAHSGNSGITYNLVSAKSPLVTTAYGSVVTTGFALTTGTDTLAITTSRTTDQSAEYLFKHAYDNPATTYWFGKLHTPATQNAAGYIDFGATNITVTGVTLSGSAFATTGTVTLASSAICSAPVVKSSGVFSAGPINNVTGKVTLTGSARWDITTGGTAPTGSAAAGNTIRVTSATSGANFDFQAFVFNAATTFENTSGNPITLIMGGGQVQPTKLETSGTITFSAPVITQSVTVTGFTAGSRIQIYDASTAAPVGSRELFNGTASAGNTVITGSTAVWTDPLAAAATRDIRVRVSYVSGATAKNFIEANIGTCGLTSGTAAVSYLANQSNDTTYNSNAVNGSTVTGITFTDSAIDLVNCNIAGGSVTWSTIYAAFVYWNSTATGIANNFTYVSAPDTANYILSSMKVKNTSAGIPLSITGGYGRDATSGLSKDIIDTTGGFIFLAPDHVVAYQTTGTYAITGDISTVLTAVGNVPANVLSAATAAPIASDIKKVNAVTVNGNGSTTPWGP